MSDEFSVAVKRVVADPAAGPALDELVNTEAARLISELNGDEFDLSAAVDDSRIAPRLDRYAVLTSGLARAFALGARWSGDLARPIWPAVLQRVVAGVDRSGGQATWADLSLYPGVLLTYAFGVGSLAGGGYDNLAAILLEPRVRHRNEWQQAVAILYGQAVLESAQALRAGLPSTFIPLSDRLAADLRPPLAVVVPDQVAFDGLFDRFECLLGLVYSDAMKVGWAPTGRFVYDQYGTGADKLIEAEIAEAGASWAPLTAGLFAGSKDRLDEALGSWRSVVEAVRREARFRRFR
jgi:hypothetical protein